MEKRFPACVLLAAGMLSLAGTASHSADQSLQDDPVTANLVSVAEEVTEVTLQFDLPTSVLAGEGVSRLHEVSGTEAEGVTKYRITIPENPEPFFSEEVILGHQSKVLPTHKPLVTRRASKSKSFTSRPKHSTAFLPRKEELENDTLQEVRLPLASIPGETDAVDALVITPPDTVPPERAGQRVGPTSLSRAAGTLPPFPRPESGGSPAGTTPVPAKPEGEALPMLIPKARDSSSRAEGAQPLLRVRAASVAPAARLPAEVPGPLIEEGSAATSWQLLPEELPSAVPGAAVGPHTSSSTSTPGGGRRAAVLNPAPPSAQSNSPPSPSLSTPEAPPSESSLQPDESGGFHPGIPAKHLSPPSLPPLSTQSGPSSLREERLHEVSTSRQETDLQTAAQSSRFMLPPAAGAPRGSPPLPNLKGAIAKGRPKAPFLGQSKPQPSAAPRLLYSKPWASLPGPSLLGQSPSLGAGPAVTSQAASSRAGTPSPARATGAPAGHITEGPSELQPPSTFPALHREQTSPRTALPSHMGSAPLALSSASTSTQAGLQASGFPARPTGPATFTPPPAAPRHETKGPSTAPTAFARTKPPMRGGLSSLQGKPYTLVVTDSEPRQPGWPTDVHDELQESTLGPFVSSRAKQPMVDTSTAAHTRPTPSPVKLDVILATSGTPPSAASSTPGTTFLHHSKPELPPNVSVPSYSKRPSPLAQGSCSSRPSSIHPPTEGEQRVVRPGLGVSPGARSQVPPGASATSMDQSGFQATSALTHAKPKTKGTLVERRHPVLADAKPWETATSASSPAKAGSLHLSAHSHVQHQLPEVSAKPGTHPLPQTGTQMLKTAPSAPVQLLSLEATIPSHLQARTPSTSAYVNTDSPTLGAFPLADAGAPIPSITSVLPFLQTKTTTFLPLTTHTLAKQSERKGSHQTSLPNYRDGTAGTPLQRVSTSLLARRRPTVGSPIRPVSQHSNADVPLASPADAEESILDLKTTSMLVGAGASNLTESILESIIQHLERPEGPAAESSDSLWAGGYLGTSPSLQSLSLFVRKAENMVCLQALQNSTPSPGEPGPIGEGMASLLSSALGLSYLGASRQIPVGPSSAILVKPVIIFLPADKPKGPVLPSVGEDGEHEARLAPTNKTVLGLVKSGRSQEQLVKMISPTLPTVLHPTRPHALSAKTCLSDKQVLSGPVLTTFPRYTELGLVGSNNFTANPLPHQLKELSTRTKYLQTRHPDKGLQAPPLHSHDPMPSSVGTSAEHHPSVAPPVTVPVLKRPQTSQPPTGWLTALSKNSPLRSLLEPGSPQVPRSSLPRSEATGKRRLGTIRICPTRDHPHMSMTPIAPTRKNSGEPVSAFSAGNMKLPLGMRGWFTPPRSSLSSELLGKTLSRVHSVPNALSNIPSRSTGKGHKGSATLKDLSPEAAAAFPLATERSSYCTNTILAKPFPFHPLSLKSPVESGKLRALPSSPGQTTLPRKELEHVTKPQAHSGPSATMSSQASRDFHFAKLVMKYNPATHTHRGKLTHARVVEPLEPTVKKGESDRPSGGMKMFRLAEASSFAPTLPSANSAHPSAWQAASDFRSASTAPHDAEEATGPPRWFHAPPRHSIPLLAPGRALEDSTLSPVAGEAALLKTPHGGPNRLQLKIRGTSEAALFAPSANKAGLLEPRRGASTTSHFYPEPGSLKWALLERPKLLDVGWARAVGSSLPSSPSPSPPSGLSVVTPAPTFLLATSAGLAGGPVRGVRPLGSSERSLQSHVQPTSGNLSDLSTMSADGDAASSPGKSHQSLPYAVDEQVAVTTSPAGDGEGEGEEAGEGEERQDAAVALLPWDSGLLDWRAHARRSLRPDDEPLVGYATLSDDTCGSGNYSTEISLQPAAAGSPASPPDSFLAQVVLQEKSSRPALSIRSCCVTPSVRPAALDRSACCFFPRPGGRRGAPAGAEGSVVECRHIQVHQNSQSQAASFTIQLFQMLDRSVAYLHCELSVCPKEHAGCGQSCPGGRDAPSKPGSTSNYETRHNVISFGPVLRAQASFLPGPAAGSQLTGVLLAVLISLTGVAVVMGALAFLCFYLRSQPKRATSLEQKGTGGP